MMVMNKMHEPALRAIAQHFGGGGSAVKKAYIVELVSPRSLRLRSAARSSGSVSG